MKDYILDHDWGSYEHNETINKLLLRNKQDFNKYFNKILKEIFVANISNDNKITFLDGTIYKLEINNIKTIIN